MRGRLDEQKFQLEKCDGSQRGVGENGREVLVRIGKKE